MTSDALKASIRNNPAAMVLSDPNQPDNPLVFVNDAFEKITLYSKAAAIGRNCRFLQCDDTDADEVAKLREAIKAEVEVTADLINQRADGTTFLNRVVIAPLRDKSGKVHAFLGIQSEITGDAGDQSTEVSAGSEQMMRELQHRVKNHLSMVVSLIRMQSKQDITAASFEALSHRVQSLALLYEELSPSGVVGRGAETLPAGAYLSRVAHTIGAIDGRASIRLNVECDEVEMAVETGARMGLLLTEFITNAFEHAFQGRDEGVVTVRLARQTRGMLRLTVEDDGVGMPEGSNWPDNAPTVEARQDEAREAKETDRALDTRGTKRKSGAGGSIVRAMIDSLDGELTVMSSENGTIVMLDIAEDGASAEGS